jgi:hypothetical protein
MKIVHAGPVSMYLSAVPSGQQISQYDGSGEWVKIKTFGVEMRKNWTKPHWLPNNNNDTFYNSATPNPPVRVSTSPVLIDKGGILSWLPADAVQDSHADSSGCVSAPC